MLDACLIGSAARRSRDDDWGTMGNPRRLTHADGEVWITDLDDGAREIRITVFDTTPLLPG
jgi:hypothetical protein